MPSASNNLMMNATDCCCTNMHKQKNPVLVHCRFIFIVFSFFKVVYLIP